MEKKKPRIQIKDLDVNLEELKKISPEVLAKIRGGLGFPIGNTYGCITYACQGGLRPPTWGKNCYPGGPYGW
jgi:hypothetical protein